MLVEVEAGASAAATRVTTERLGAWAAVNICLLAALTGAGCWACAMTRTEAREAAATKGSGRRELVAQELEVRFIMEAMPKHEAADQLRSRAEAGTVL